MQKFHNSQSDIRIEEVGFPFSEFSNRVLTQIAGGRLDADVLSFSDDIALRLIRGGHLAPMDEVVSALGVGDKLTPATDFVRSDGKLYGLAAVVVPYAIIYNKELYDKAGVTPPTTQDEYIATAAKLTKRPDQFGHAGRNTMQEATGWITDLTHWVFGYGGRWAVAKKPTVTEEPALKAVAAYKKLYDEAMPQGADASTYRRMAWEGKIAQYIDNSANINILRTGNPDIYPKIFTAPPPWENRQSVALPSFVGIYSGTRNLDAARVWWEFVFKPENYQEHMKNALDIVGPYEGAADPAYLQGLHWASGFLAAQGRTLPYAMEGFESNIAEFRQILLQNVSEVLTAGKDIEEAMKQAQAQLEELASRI